MQHILVGRYVEFTYGMRAALFALNAAIFVIGGLIPPRAGHRNWQSVLGWTNPVMGGICATLVGWFWFLSEARGNYQDLLDHLLVLGWAALWASIVLVCLGIALLVVVRAVVWVCRGGLKQ